jgi:predicted nucleic-acid-binding protein
MFRQSRGAGEALQVEARWESYAVEVLFRNASKGKIQLVTSSLAIAEIVWTLESYYELDKKEIQTMVLGILNTDGLEVMNSDLLLQAIIPYAEKNVDFIDAFDAAWMVRNDVDIIYTYDQNTSTDSRE